MTIWNNTGNGQQNAGMAGALGSGQLQGLGGGYIRTTIPQDLETALRNQLHALQQELKSQQSIRAMDSVLLRRHYRIWAWLQDTHPEVVKEFEAVEDLLKASGENF